MISVILYGRNDSHGYNLHKRAAISLNCIAEVLSEPDDEMLFVDYNTPNDLPAFVEAIYDTLTPRAKTLLRVLRVRPEQHARLAARTHLAALEPHSRNIAIRRSNPRNRWVLFTNTDMIFVPRDGVSSLSGAVRDLADGQYILPRFELPEPLWESFPRSDPAAIMRACEELGRRLHLNEISVSHPYMRYDSPGDFQLVPRQTLFDIHGFDERMIHGWHADSNMCKRLYVLFGRTEGLANRLKGYHCDHTRVATLAHRLDIKLENDLQEFVYGVEDPAAPGQAETWGAPGEPIEEIDFTNGPNARFACAVERAVGEPQQADYHSNAIEVRNYVWYQPEHVIPHAAGYLTVYPQQARFLYAGNNPKMLALLGTAIAQMGFAQPLSYLSDLLTAGAVPDAAGVRPVGLGEGMERYADLAANFDLLVFDFGLDRTGTGLPARIARVTDWPRSLRYSLGAVARCLRDCAEEIGARGARGPDFLVLNANHYVFDQFASRFLLLAQTPFHTRARKGRARSAEERLYRSPASKYTEESLRAFFGYDLEEDRVPVVAAGQTVDLTACGNASPYKDGNWGMIDTNGAWTDGSRAVVLFSLAAPAETDLIAHVRITEVFQGADGAPIRVGISLNGERLIRWNVARRDSAATYKTILPRRLLNDHPVCRLGLEIENPQSAQAAAAAEGRQTIGEDPRELGVKVQRITLTGVERLRYPFGRLIDFTEKGEGMLHIDEHWTTPDNLGTWTLGPDASIVMFVEEAQTQAIATFLITDAAVSEEYPNVLVWVSFNGVRLEQWKLGPSRMHVERKVFVPAHVLKAQSPLCIAFHVEEPRSPAELKWSATDRRPLGFRLTSFRMDAVPIPRYTLGEVIDFTAGGNAGPFLGAQWSAPDQFGAWTVGEKAAITLQLDRPTHGAVPASFIISDCMVSKDAPALPVLVKANGRLAGAWTLGPDRVTHRRTLDLPPDAVAGGSITLEFEVPAPRTPQSLGWSGDTRPLGIRLSHALIGSGELALPVFGTEGVPRSGLGERVRGLIGSLIHELRPGAKRTV
jgi:hypothetical protein